MPQCCDSTIDVDTDSIHSCRRWIGSNDDAGCFGGAKPPRETTYAETEAKCAAASLTLCQQRGKGRGGSYNEGPGWTKLPCQVQSAPTPAPPSGACPSRSPSALTATA